MSLPLPCFVSLQRLLLWWSCLHVLIEGAQRFSISILSTERVSLPLASSLISNITSLRRVSLRDETRNQMHLDINSIFFSDLSQGF